MSEFDLSQPMVLSKLQERYGNAIPYDEKVISLSEIYYSEMLERIKEN